MCQNRSSNYLATMNYVDIVLFVFLALGIYRGFKKGLIVAVFSALALFVGLYGGIHFSDYVAELLNQTFNIDADWLPFAAFALTFIGLIVGIHLMAKGITKALNITLLGTVNKIAGAAFGFARMALMISISLLILHPLNLKTGLVKPEVYQASLLYLPMYNFSSALIPAILNSDFFAYITEMEWVPQTLLDQLPSSEG